MGKKKKHPIDLRDRDADMKLLAASFFDYLTLLTSKRHEAGVWGIDPKWLLGKGNTSDSNAVAKEVLSVIDYSFDGECSHCGQETSEPDEKAIAYALDLWSELGVYLEGRWAELHEIEAEHLSCGTEEEETCCDSDEECDDCGNHLCENEDHECVETQVCGTCENDFSECVCTDEEEEVEEETEEEEEEEDEDVCSDCGDEYDVFGECSCNED
jgi:hypothetical protein